MKRKLYYLLLAGMLVPTVGFTQAGRTLSPTKNLNAYVGTWEYVTATETFRITFVEGTRYGVSTYSECVIGGYFYQKNGTTIASHMSNIPTVNDVGNETLVKIMGTNSKLKPEWVDPNELRIYFYDDVYDKHSGSGSFRLLSSTTAEWKLENDEEGGVDVRFAKPEAFSVPTKVVMTKVVEQTPPNPPVVPGAPIGWIDFGD